MRVWYERLVGGPLRAGRAVRGPERQWRTRCRNAARVLDLGRPERPQRDATDHRNPGLARVGAPGAARPGAATTLRAGGVRLDRRLYRRPTAGRVQSGAGG